MTLTQSKPPAGFRKHVLALIGETYGDKTLVLCPTVFVKLLNGDHKAAILLSQILYWSDRTKDPDGWFYKSFRDWREETGLSEYQVRRILNGDPRVQSPQITLRALGVETRLRKVRRTGAPTLHYRIDHDHFLAVLQAFLGQGDSSQGAESILNIAQDQPATTPGMNSEQCAASSLDPETTFQQTSAADPLSSYPTHCPDDDSDCIFQPFEGRFGKLKDRFLEPLRQHQERLGGPTLRAVLERCARRGRSWNYVLKALANEAPDRQPKRPAEAAGAVFPAFSTELDNLYPNAPSDAPAPVSERLQGILGTGQPPGRTVQEVWDATANQLALQLDPITFYSHLRAARLVDYVPESRTLVVAVSTPHARELCQGRLLRTLQRILRDTAGQGLELQFLTEAEWRGQVQPETGVDAARSA